MDSHQAPPGHAQGAQTLQQPQQQPMLPPWYRLGNSQPQPQQQAALVNPSSTSVHSSSNGSIASTTGYSQPSGNPPAGSSWRSNSPSLYQRPNTPGRGNSSSWCSGSSSASGYGDASGGSYGVQRQYSGGRGYGGYRGGRGRGSPSPNRRAPGPPVWVKQDCWLEPKPGSVEAAAYAAAVARHKQLLKEAQQQAQPAGLTVGVPAAAVTSTGTTATAAVAVTASATDSGVIDLTADDGDQAAAADGSTQQATSTSAVAAAAAAAVSPSKAEVIDLSGQATLASPRTAVAGQLSGLQLLLQQHRSQQQPPQKQQQQAPQAAPQQSPRVVYIMRGLPGAGKSTRAAQIAAEARTASSSSSSSVDPVAIHSTDTYFVDPYTGVYRFSMEQLSTHHERNFNAFCASLQAGVGTVIVDNTNLQPWQYEKYVQQAWSAGYRVREEVVGEFAPAVLAVYAQRNVHGVPLDKLQMMLDQWHNQ